MRIKCSKVSCVLQSIWCRGSGGEVAAILSCPVLWCDDGINADTTYKVLWAGSCHCMVTQWNYYFKNQFKFCVLRKRGDSDNTHCPSSSHGTLSFGGTCGSLNTLQTFKLLPWPKKPFYHFSICQNATLDLGLGGAESKSQSLWIAVKLFSPPPTHPVTLSPGNVWWAPMHPISYLASLLPSNFSSGSLAWFQIPSGHNLITICPCLERTFSYLRLLSCVYWFLVPSPLEMPKPREKIGQCYSWSW